jgi:hypothetical protein
VFEDMARLELFNREPWISSYLQGIIDAPFLNLTPGTRSGVIHDSALQSLSDALAKVEENLRLIIDEQHRAEEERASVRILRSVQKALKEALMALPAEEYDWFDIHGYESSRPGRNRPSLTVEESGDNSVAQNNLSNENTRQKSFFEFAGPLFSVKISPQSCVLPVGTIRTLRAIARDRKRKLIEEKVIFQWEIVEGEGSLSSTGSEIVEFRAAGEPGLVKIKVTATQGEVACVGEGLITVTESLLPERDETSATHQGLPGYTFKKAPGELWRSRYDEDQNVIVVNNGHRDYVFASKNKALKIRYISRLFAKELIIRNFKGIPPDGLLERMIELTLYMEENL